MTGYYVLRRYPDGSIMKPDIVYLARVDAERNCCSDRGECVCEVRIEFVDVIGQDRVDPDEYLRQDRVDSDEYLRREV